MVIKQTDIWLTNIHHINDMTYLITDNMYEYFVQIHYKKKSKLKYILYLIPGPSSISCSAYIMNKVKSRGDKEHPCLIRFLIKDSFHSYKHTKIVQEFLTKLTN